MLKKLLTATLLAGALVAPASAQSPAVVTEQSAAFPNQTALFGPSALLAAPTANGSYQLCVYVDQPASSLPMQTVIQWTDENGEAQSWVAAESYGSQGSCGPLIRNQANTAPTLETNWNYPGAYSIYVIGLGFWPTGTQGEGGLSESISYDIASQSAGTTTLLTPAATGLYLVAVTNPLLSGEGSTAYLQYTDNQGTETANVAGGGFTNGTVVPVHAIGGTPIQLVLTGSQESGTQFFVKGIHFGTPAYGSGPLTDYQYNMLGWTNATDPNSKTILTTNGGAVFSVSGNIAEVPNYGSVDEEAYLTPPPGDPANLTFYGATPSGAPSNLAPWIAVGYVPTSSTGVAFTVETENSPAPAWGASPTYSAEFDVLQFQ